MFPYGKISFKAAFCRFQQNLLLCMRLKVESTSFVHQSMGEQSSQVSTIWNFFSKATQLIIILIVYKGNAWPLCDLKQYGYGTLQGLLHQFFADKRLQKPIWRHLASNFSDRLWVTPFLQMSAIKFQWVAVIIYSATHFKCNFSDSCILLLWLPESIASHSCSVSYNC